MYNGIIGRYMEPLFRKISFRERLQQDLPFLTSYLLPFCKCECRQGKNNDSKVHSAHVPTTKIDIPETYDDYSFEAQYVLRDIFIWVVIQGYVEMAFVLLLHTKCRISAALIAAGITRRLMDGLHGHLEQYDKLKKQSLEYEKFATECIDICFKTDEMRACQLLFREVPLFGNVTCMQVKLN